jgi:hypothetical protein
MFPKHGADVLFGVLKQKRVRVPHGESTCFVYPSCRPKLHAVGQEFIVSESKSTYF